MTQESSWYEMASDVVGFALWMDSEVCYFDQPVDVIRLFEKPWKWESEYKLWQRWLRAESEEEREECVNRAIEGPDSGDMVFEKVSELLDRFGFGFASGM